MEKLNNVEWEKLKPETADFIFGESEKLLINQIETSKLLTKRAETIIGFAVPILIVIVGYVVNFISQFDANIESQGYLPLVAGVYSSAAIIIILAFSIDVFWIYQIRPCGNNPRGMISQWKIDSPNLKAPLKVVTI